MENVIALEMLTTNYRNSNIVVDRRVKVIEHNDCKSNSKKSYYYLKVIVAVVVIVMTIVIMKVLHIYILHIFHVIIIIIILMSDRHTC